MRRRDLTTPSREMQGPIGPRRSATLHFLFFFLSLYHNRGLLAVIFNRRE